MSLAELLINVEVEAVEHGRAMARNFFDEIAELAKGDFMASFPVPPIANNPQPATGQLWQWKNCSNKCWGNPFILGERYTPQLGVMSGWRIRSCGDPECHENHEGGVVPESWFNNLCFVDGTLTFVSHGTVFGANAFANGTLTFVDGGTEESQKTAYIVTDPIFIGRFPARKDLAPAPASPHKFDNPYLVLPGKVLACSACGQSGRVEINCIPHPDPHRVVEMAILVATIGGELHTAGQSPPKQAKPEDLDPLWQRSPGIGIWSIR